MKPLLLLVAAAMAMTVVFSISGCGAPVINDVAPQHYVNEIVAIGLSVNDDVLYV